jgi:predicted permease
MPAIQQTLEIFLQVILPILVIIGLGALIQRFFPLHLPTLSKINIYLLVPIFLFVRVYTADLSWGQMGGIVLAVIIPLVILGPPLLGVMRQAKVQPDTIAAILVGGLIFNAGNFGIPVAELHYGQAGGQVQALVAMTSNLCIWCLAYIVIAIAQGKGGWSAAVGYFKLPMFYVLILAFGLRLLREQGVTMPTWAAPAIKPIWTSMEMVALAVIPMALITLGAQLAQQARWPNWRIIGPIMLLKLIAVPAVTAVVVWMMGLWPWPGAMIIVAASAPTAVNILLLTIELEGDAHTAADSVFWTTLFSAITVTICMAIVDAAGGGPPGWSAGSP